MSSCILFQSATVITGDEGAKPFIADVLVRDGRIARIGEPGSVKSEEARAVDATGHYLSPGFIDMHAHSDLYLITNPVHEAKITQGCTVSALLLQLRGPVRLITLRLRLSGKMASPMHLSATSSNSAPSAIRLRAGMATRAMKNARLSTAIRAFSNGKLLATISIASRKTVQLPMLPCWCRRVTCACWRAGQTTQPPQWKRLRIK